MLNDSQGFPYEEKDGTGCISCREHHVSLMGISPRRRGLLMGPNKERQHKLGFPFFGSPRKHELRGDSLQQFAGAVRETRRKWVDDPFHCITINNHPSNPSNPSIPLGVSGAPLESVAVNQGDLRWRSLLLDPPAPQGATRHWVQVQVLLWGPKRQPQINGSTFINRLSAIYTIWTFKIWRTLDWSREETIARTTVAPFRRVLNLALRFHKSSHISRRGDDASSCRNSSMNE